MPPTSQTYVPVHCYCSLHIDPTLPHIQVKKSTATFNYHAIVIYVPSNKYDPQMLYMPVSSCADIIQLC